MRIVSSVLLSAGLLLSGAACSFSFQASAGSKSSSAPSGSQTGKPPKPSAKKGPTKKKLNKGNGSAPQPAPDNGGLPGGADDRDASEQTPPPDRQPTRGNRSAESTKGGTTLSARPKKDDPENPDTITNRSSDAQPSSNPGTVTARPKPKTPPSATNEISAPK